MDDNGYCNSKSNNDQLFQPRVLVLFVHGFLGSESSFCSFPLDLVQTVRKQYKIQNLEARIFPFFETKGDPEKAINSLHNWLLLNASMPEFESVIIVAHSMGGLITVDAMRKILKTSETKQSIEKKEKHLSIATVDVAYEDLVKAEIGEKADEKDLKDPDDVPLEPQQRGWFSGLWSSSSSSKEQIIHAPLDISSEKQQIPSNIVVGDTLKSFPIEDRKEDSNFYRPKTIHKGESQVNIGAIIAFDSPFYGLSSSLFTRGAGDYSADLISDYVTRKQSALR